MTILATKNLRSLAFINRMGGKSYLTKWLCSFLPEHRLFCEPFAGGAKLLFAKEPSPVEILNDTDNELVNLYRCIQGDGKRQMLINFLNELPYSRSLFNHFRQTKQENDIKKAVRYFYLSKASFAGDVGFGGFACPSRSTRRNPAMTYQNSIDALEHVAKRLRGVTIECLDYAECIRRYDSMDTLFYCDPPYLNTEDYYGKGCFALEDHYSFAELLHGIKGKVMITHYQNSLYDEVYQGWNKYTFESFKGSYKSNGESKPKTLECLYCNFEPLQTGLFNGAV